MFCHLFCNIYLSFSISIGTDVSYIFADVVDFLIASWVGSETNLVIFFCNFISNQTLFLCQNSRWSPVFILNLILFLNLLTYISELGIDYCFIIDLSLIYHAFWWYSLKIVLNIWYRIRFIRYFKLFISS